MEWCKTWRRQQVLILLCPSHYEGSCCQEQTTGLLPKKTQSRLLEDRVIAVPITKIHFWTRSLRKMGQMGIKGSHGASFAVRQTAVELSPADPRVAGAAAKGPRWHSGAGGWMACLDLSPFGGNALSMCHGHRMGQHGARRPALASTRQLSALVDGRRPASFWTPSLIKTCVKYVRKENGC